MVKSTRSGLGRGLNSLLGGYYDEPQQEKPVEKEQIAQKPVEKTPSSTERVVIESSDLQQVMNTEMAANKTSQPSSKPPVMNKQPEVVIEKPSPSEAVTAPTLSERKDPEPEVAEKPTDEIAVADIEPNPDQPRTNFKQEEIEELAASIKKDGLLQPIVVRPMENGKYQIIAGERRFRAARMAGLEEVPVIIRTVDQTQALAMALIENMQREDLNPLEEAAGIQRLIDECDYTHEQAAEAVGRSRTATTNLLRLLTLTPEVKAMLKERKLEMGHARALLALDAAEQVLAAKEVVAKALSVRQTEDLIRRIKEKQPVRQKFVVKTRDDIRLEESLAETLGAVVKLSANSKGKGRIVIEFTNLDQLEGIVHRIQQQGH